MTAINRPEGSVTDLGSYDALVVGGGLSGWAAGVALAGAGHQVLLAGERTGLGHEVSSALSLWPGDDERLATSPLMQEIAEGLAAVDALQAGAMDPVATQVLLDRLTVEAGVKLLLQVWCHPREDGQAVLSGKWGTMAARARVIVDGTRKAVPAVEAGVRAVPRETDELPMRRALIINAKSDADTELEVGEDLPIAGGKVRAWPGVWPGDVILEAHLDLDSADPAQFELEGRAAMIEATARLRERVEAFENASLVMVAHEAILPRSEVILGRDDETAATELATESGTVAVKRGAFLPEGTESLVLASPAADLGEVSAVECYQASSAVRIGEAAGAIACELLEA